MNSNNIQDAGEYKLPNWNLDLNGFNLASNSIDTTFKAKVTTGTFVLTPDDLSAGYSSVPLSDTFNYNTFGNVDTNVSFALQPVSSYNDIGVTVGINSTIRVNTPSYAQVSVTNYGTSVASAVLRIVVDTAIDSVVIPYQPDSVINGTDYYYTMNNISQLTTRTLTIGIVELNTGAIGDTLPMQVTVTSSISDSVSSNDTVNSEIIVMAAYDPNMKSASKMTIQYDEYLEDKGLNYHVQFQNTGNAEAFNVWVRDTLPATLNPQSLKMIASSHPCSHKLLGNILEVSFPDINLPDSTTDPAGSIGWFTFQSSMSDGLNVLDAVENRVGIYFDQNPVVLTEHAITLIINNEEFPQGITTSFQPQANVFPNPARDEITIKVNDFSGHDQLSLHDVQGRVIGQWSMNASEQTISIEGVAPGLYFLSVGSQSADPVKVMVQ